MLVCFLDFDGVLNCALSIKEFGDDSLDPFRVRLLNRLASFDVKFVVSSTWRLYSSFEDLENILEKCGFKGELIGTTPYIAEDIKNKRGAEIDIWLKAQDDIDNFIILDDDNDISPFEDHLVKTTFVYGLQDRHIDIALKLLGLEA